MKVKDEKHGIAYDEGEEQEVKMEWGKNGGERQEIWRVGYRWQNTDDELIQE